MPLVLGEYTSDLDAIISWSKGFWEYPQHPHFTLHGPKHSRSITIKIDQWLAPCSLTLTHAEVFVLLGAVWLHDIGMQCCHSEFLSKYCGIRYETTLTPDQLNVVRVHHGELSYHMIRDAIRAAGTRDYPELGLDCTGRQSEFNAIALISKGHCGEIPPEVVNEYRGITGQVVRLLLLAHILRVGDALDAEESRTNKEHYKRADWAAFAPVDKFHWLKHQYVANIEVIGAGEFRFHYAIPESEQQYYDLIRECAEKLLRKHVVDNGRLIRQLGVPLSGVESKLLPGDPVLTFPMDAAALAEFRRQVGSGAPPTYEVVRNIVSMRDATGPLPAGHSAYVERKSDRDVLTALNECRGICTIWGPRQIGKTSLAIRAIADASRKGRKTAFVDVSGLGGANLDQVLFRLATKIAQEIGIAAPVSNVYLLSPKGSEQAFEEFICGFSPGTLLVLDEVEYLKHIDTFMRFFVQLRAVFSRLYLMGADVRLLVVSLHPPEQFIIGPTSPWNMGTRIRMMNFDRMQCLALLQNAGLSATDNETDELLCVTGGQPFLLHQTALRVRGGEDISAILREASLPNGPFASHLSAVHLLVKKSRAAATFLKNLLASKMTDRETGERLVELGILQHQGSSFNFSCTAYRDFFARIL